MSEKARSRLNIEAKKTKLNRSLLTPKIEINTFLNFFKKYFQHVQTLLLSLPGIVLTFFILTSVYPDDIKNFLIPQSYLPLLISFFAGSFFLLSFIFLNTRRGLWLSVYLTLLLFFKLQMVTYDFFSIGIPLMFFGILELSWMLFLKNNTKKQSVTAHHANIKQKN